MRILWATFSLQHPAMRGSARHYYFVRELAARHSVTLLALSDVSVPPDVRAELWGYVDGLHTIEVADRSRDASSGRRSVVKSLRKARGRRDAVARMRQTVDGLVASERFDVAILHGKDLLPVVEGCPDLALVSDFCDASALRFAQQARIVGRRRRPLLQAQARIMERLERRLVRATPYQAFISARDRDAVLGPHADAAVIPNGVDLDYWRRRSAARRPRRLVFTGVMDYFPNEDAALVLLDDVLPRVQARMPDVEVAIVGRDPRRILTERASGRPEVTVTGTVDDLRPYLEEATVFVAPLRAASGMQNKVQEALAMEVPVVTTEVVAAGLLSERGGRPPLVVANGPDEMAASVVELLEDEPARARLAAEGRRFAEDHFQWPRSAARLEELCLAAAAAAAAPTEKGVA